MRLLIYTTLLSFIYCVSSKNNVKSLAESMGQEVIEIGAPVKELPPGFEEEPAAENDDEDKLSSETILPATKKEIKKTTLAPDTRRKSKKDIDKLDGVAQDDEEARIEKELAEIYKDTPDYKADSAEPAKEKVTLRTTVEEVDKTIARQRKTNFHGNEYVNGGVTIPAKKIHGSGTNVGQYATTNYYGDIDSDEYVERGELPPAKKNLGDMGGDYYNMESDRVRGEVKPKPNPTGVPLHEEKKVSLKKNSASNFIIRSTYICLTTFIALY